MRDLSLHILDLMQNSIRAQAAVVSLSVLLNEEGILSIIIEDDGTGICFNVFCYNVQPHIIINYADGTSKVESAPETAETNEVANEESTITYILNTNTKKFHYPDCDSVNAMKEKNKKVFTGTREEAIEMGYSPCERCKP